MAQYRFKSNGKQRVKGLPYPKRKQIPQPLKRFNGVATKYLQHYLAWFRYLDSKEYENTAASKKICW